MQFINIILYKSIMKIYLLFILPIVLSSAINQRKNLSLTIYNDNYAMVKDIRDISFDPGYSYLSIDDVAATIQPETVAFRPQDKKLKIFILQQNFENNLVGKQAVLRKYLNKVITVYVRLADTKVVDITGKLLAYSPSYILQNNQGVQVYDQVKGIKLPQLPEGLLTLPALVWKVRNPLNQLISSNCEIAYKATGFSWKADYTLILNDLETLMDFAGWVTIENNSGKKYQKAKVKLIAGDVNTVRRYSGYYKSYRIAYAAPMGGSAAVSEKTFGDYHMYTIKRRVDLNESSTKQIEFIPLVVEAKIEKYYRVSISTGGYSEYNLKAENMIKFLNSKDNKMGLPLPKGTIRTFKQDSSDGSLQFVGEDSIDHTPKDQYVKLKTGNAFDLVVKKIIKSRSSKDSGNWEAEVKLQLTNHRNRTSVVVVEISNSYGDNLEVIWQQSQQLIKQSTNKYNVTVKIAPDEKRTLNWRQNYRVLY